MLSYKEVFNNGKQKICYFFDKNKCDNINAVEVDSITQIPKTGNSIASGKGTFVKSEKIMGFTIYHKIVLKKINSPGFFFILYRVPKELQPGAISLEYHFIDHSDKSNCFQPHSFLN